MSDAISIPLKKSIYQAVIIRRAIQDYRGICQIQLLEQPDQYVCVVTSSVTDLALTAHEFSNYLIELANVRRAFL